MPGLDLWQLGGHSPGRYSHDRPLLLEVVYLGRLACRGRGSCQRGRVWRRIRRWALGTG